MIIKRSIFTKIQKLFRIHEKESPKVEKNKEVTEEGFHPIRLTDQNYKKNQYGGAIVHRASTRSEIIFTRNQSKYSEFVQSLSDPTIVSLRKNVVLPEPSDLPPNIPARSLFGISSKYNSNSWVFPPKPLQEAHEHFLFDSTVKSGSSSDLLSPLDRFQLHIDHVFRRVSRATSSTDLVTILRNDWLQPPSILSTPSESLRRTLEVILQLGQIKQFAFLNSPHLDGFLMEIIEYCENKAARMTPDQLSDLCWSFAKLGARPPVLVKKMLPKIESIISSFSMSQMSDIFFCFEELRVDSPRFYKALEKCVLSNQPRSLGELNPTQLSQLSYAVIIGSKPQDQRKAVCLRLCQQLASIWKNRPFFPVSSMLQLCRFTTAVNLFFPGDRFKGVIPNELRERALYIFKSGRAEMYSPPFLDPMTREVIKTHFTTMMLKQNPITVGINGWWLWSLDRRTPPFSLEPASRTWYTRFDDRKRMLGSFMFRNQIIERHGLLTLHVPYYEWEVYSTNRGRYEYLEKKMFDQLGMSHLKKNILFSHLLGVDIKGRNYRKDDEQLAKDTEIAWDWNELCEINAKNCINPNLFVNESNFKVPHAVYNDEQRLLKPDYWNE